MARVCWALLPFGDLRIVAPCSLSAFVAPCGNGGVEDCNVACALTPPFQLLRVADESW